MKDVTMKDKTYFDQHHPVIGYGFKEFLKVNPDISTEENYMIDVIKKDFHGVLIHPWGRGEYGRKGYFNKAFNMTFIPV